MESRSIFLIWINLHNNCLCQVFCYSRTETSSVLLQLNERNVSDNTTSIELSADEKDLKFCCLNSPTPCRTKIIYDNETLAQSTACSTIEIDSGAINRTYEFFFALCSKDFSSWMIQVLKSECSCFMSGNFNIADFSFNLFSFVSVYPINVVYII